MVEYCDGGGEKIPSFKNAHRLIKRGLDKGRWCLLRRRYKSFRASKEWGQIGGFPEGQQSQIAQWIPGKSNQNNLGNIWKDLKDIWEISNIQISVETRSATSFYPILSIPIPSRGCIPSHEQFLKEMVIIYKKRKKLKRIRGKSDGWWVILVQQSKFIAAVMKREKSKCQFRLILIQHQFCKLDFWKWENILKLNLWKFKTCFPV